MSEIVEAITDSSNEEVKRVASPSLWTDLPTNHPLVSLCKKLPEIIKAAEHDEVWGVRLELPRPPFDEAVKNTEGEKVPAAALPSVPTMNVLQKYLRANKNDLEKAEKQLFDTLAWRKKFDPRHAAFEETFDAELFDGLGYVTEITTADGRKRVVVWNIYGAVKDKKKTFGDLETFLRWRVGLMERSLTPLNLATATQRIPDYDAQAATEDPYQCIQVHDYLNLSFLRMDPDVKAASKSVIALMGQNYPELLSRKFFVNVPLVMQWMFTAVKLIVAKETSNKFCVVSYGENLVHELGSGVPEKYGGKGPTLAEMNKALNS